MVANCLSLLMALGQPQGSVIGANRLITDRWPSFKILVCTPIGVPTDFAALAMPAQWDIAYREAERILLSNGVPKSLFTMMYEHIKHNTSVLDLSLCRNLQVNYAVANGPIEGRRGTQTDTPRNAQRHGRRVFPGQDQTAPPPVCRPAGHAGSQKRRSWVPGPRALRTLALAGRGVLRLLACPLPTRCLRLPRMRLSGTIYTERRPRRNSSAITGGPRPACLCGENGAVIKLVSGV